MNVIEPPNQDGSSVMTSDSGTMARLAGIEPTTLGFGGQYSIH